MPSVKKPASKAKLKAAPKPEKPKAFISRVRKEKAKLAKTRKQRKAVTKNVMDVVNDLDGFTLRATKVIKKKPLGVFQPQYSNHFIVEFPHLRGGDTLTLAVDSVSMHLESGMLNIHFKEFIDVPVFGTLHNGIESGEMDRVIIRLVAPDGSCASDRRIQFDGVKLRSWATDLNYNHGKVVKHDLWFSFHSHKFAEHAEHTYE